MPVIYKRTQQLYPAGVEFHHGMIRILLLGGQRKTVLAKHLINILSKLLRRP